MITINELSESEYNSVLFCCEVLENILKKHNDCLFKSYVNNFDDKTLLNIQFSSSRCEYPREPEICSNEHELNGIFCENCNSELYDNEPSTVMLSMPPQKKVHCKNCGYVGLRYC